MKQVVFISVLIVLVFFLLQKEKTGNPERVVETYPWQITLLPGGKSRVFGIVLNETSLAEVSNKMKTRPRMAVYESKQGLSLEAYYKNITLGGLSGSFVFTINATEQQLQQIKNNSIKKEPTKDNALRYELDKPAIDGLQLNSVKTLVYLPTVQLEEDMIVKRFGMPAKKIKLKTNEAGWHYLYPDKGLDLIYKEDDKEILQYVLPKNFNALVMPLQVDQTIQH